MNAETTPSQANKAGKSNGLTDAKVKTLKPEAKAYKAVDGGYTVFLPAAWIAPIEVTVEEAKRSALIARMTQSPSPSVKSAWRQSSRTFQRIEAKRGRPSTRSTHRPWFQSRMVCGA